MSEGQVGDLLDHTYTIAKDLSTYMNIIHNDTTRLLEENDRRTYDIESKHRLNLGDRERLKGKELVVATSIARMTKGELTYAYDYDLIAEAGIRQLRMNTPSLSGASLEGAVLEVIKEGVRLHLAIDPAQEKEKAV